MRNQTGSVANSFKYTGQQHDSSTDLYYLRARYYDPSIGRFLSRDPFPGLPTARPTLNPYAYVTNNLVEAIDPSGQCGPDHFVHSASQARSRGPRHGLW